MEHEIEEPSGDIAIIGMAGRFPMARNLAEYWQNLRAGVECIQRFSDDELRAAGVPAAVLSDPNYVNAWGWMEGIDEFDAPFFNISLREAEITDPQIRILLECAWEALEDAGLDPSRYPGRVGTFTGSSLMHYLWENLIPTPKLMESVGFTQAWIVNDRDFLSTRLNYKLDLKGPGMTVQTACSTSLVAVHLGVQSLLTGESDVVLAGGVSAPMPDKHGYMFSEGGTLSPDGHVRAFDAAGKGMLGGNGVGLVVLKRLEDALADRDNIRGIVKATALNNDGVDKVTFTAPSVDGQVRVLLDALDIGGIDPESISCVEAHGTGTPLGDPIEIAALTQAWGSRTEAKGWCPISSVKSNIGHLDTAAGVAGLIKAVLQLEHREIVPSLNFETPNPEIDFENSPFFVNTELRAWDTERLPRRATVSSLGMGGTNAHAILQEAPELEAAAPSRAVQLLLLSAHSASALDRSTERLAQRLEEERSPLPDVAYTTQVGRKAFTERRFVVARDTSDAVDALRARDKKRSGGGTTPASAAAARKVAFLFSGQGSQYVDMARGLYGTESVFTQTLDLCLDQLKPHVGLDLGTLMFPEGDDEAKKRAGAELALTQYTQPALFAVEYALAEQWKAWGVEPTAMLGHSIGEYVAACLAGVFSLEDALRLVASRGRLIGGLPAGGGMLTVFASEGQVQPVLQAGVTIAAFNAPELVVLSGPRDALALQEAALESAAIASRALHTSHAFHSVLMDPMLAAFESEVRTVSLAAPELPVISCTTGKLLSAAEAQDPEYWVRHVREPVRFAAGVGSVAVDNAILLEVGPGQALTSLARLNLPADAVVVPSTRHPKDSSGVKYDDLATLLHALGSLWSAGAHVDWEGFSGDEQRRRVSLPTYPFERRRLWIDRPAPGAAVAREGERGAVKCPDLESWYHVPSWKRSAPTVPLAHSGARRWLVFADENPLTGILVRQLDLIGEGQTHVFEVRPGKEFSRAGAVFTIDPERPEDYLRVLDELEQAGDLPTDVAYFWCLADESDADLARTFYAPLYLTQALAGRESTGGIRVNMVTMGMHDVLRDRSVRPELSALLGPCMSMNLELEGITARAIDLEPQHELSPEQLLNEFLSKPEHAVVCLQAENRWALTFERTLLGASAGFGPLRAGGVVLITGGLGGIGLVLAEELARANGSRLVLIGRKGLPPREDWKAWIQEHGEDDATSLKMQKVIALEAIDSKDASGTEVLVLAADCTDEASMRSALDTAERRFGSVDGVIHAAGLPAAGIVQLKSKAGAQRVLAPKVEGTRVLHRVLAGRELDFVLLCSSISSVCVGLGQVDYFAANAFMDAFAHVWNAETKTQVVAVNWDAWQEVGMAVDTEVPAEMRAERKELLRLGITNAEACESFRRILASGLPQVVVSPRELQQRGDYRARFEIHTPLHDSARTSSGADGGAAAPESGRSGRASAPRPALETAYCAPSERVEFQVAELWADLLGLEKVGLDDDFFELGGNSLVMMQVNARLRGMFGVALPIRELFELPTVRELAASMTAIRMPEDPSGSDGESDDGTSSDEVEEFTL